ncbi:MAG: hypothetical protein LBL30_01610 [Holosporales bacterium]|nr:hypothetical protein [Holosporales bacterium]
MSNVTKSSVLISGMFALVLSASSSMPAPFGAQPDEDVHAIAPRIKAEKGGEMLMEAFSNAYGADAKTLIDTGELASDGYEGFVIRHMQNRAKLLNETSCDVDPTIPEIVEIVKYFFNNGYDKVDIDPETGACPLQVLLTCAYMLRSGNEGMFSLMCHAFKDAFNPSTGGKCLQGYTVRLLVACYSAITQTAMLEQQSDKCRKQLAAARHLEEQRRELENFHRLRRQQEVAEEKAQDKAARAEEDARRAELGELPLTDKEWDEMNEELIIEPTDDEVKELRSATD